ncbi:hypothetical protein D9M69_576810 [compost metagenome]
MVIFSPLISKPPFRLLNVILSKSRKGNANFPALLIGSKPIKAPFLSVNPTVPFIEFVTKLPSFEIFPEIEELAVR